MAGADGLSMPALIEPKLPRWTASVGMGLLYAGRSQWAQAVGELELRAQPRRRLSVSLGAFVGGGRGTLERATVRSRLVTLQLLVSGHVHTRRASLDVGAGYVGALSFFTGTSLADPTLAAVGLTAVPPRRDAEAAMALRRLVFGVYAGLLRQAPARGDATPPALRRILDEASDPSTADNATID